MIKQERDTVVKCNDFHVPFHDPKAINVLIKFLSYLQPKILVIDELIDFPSISRFDKDPRRINDLQKEIDKCISILGQIREILPKTRIVMVESNHDRRLEKYKRVVAKELHNLKKLRFESLLDLDKFGIEYKKDFVFRGVLFKHGSIVRQHSSYTAKAEMERENINGCSGHTHRLGMYFKTQRGGSYVWLETGCLCKTKNVEYLEGCVANWQQGLGIFAFEKDSKHFYPTVVPIIDYKILWGSKTFK